MTQLVVINVTQLNAPAPSMLQQTGAIISQGGTTLSAGTYAIVPSLSTLGSLQTPSHAISSITWTSSVATATITGGHGIPGTTTVLGVISGVSSAGTASYDGTFACTATGTATLTYPLTGNPGTSTALGTFTLNSVGEVLNQFTTYFAQGTNVSPYVLELGVTTPAAGITALTTFINASAQFFYQYLVPLEWDNATGFVTFLGNYTAPTKMTYFHIMTSQANYSLYAGLKAAQCYIQNAAEAATVFDAATGFAIQLNTSPSSSSKVAPFSFRYCYGVTAYPTNGNLALLNTLQAASVNYIGTASQGGITNTIIVGGNTMDGNPFNYWYATDWCIINLSLMLANTIYNGSNSQPPLYYNQPGIDTLKSVAQQTLVNGSVFGLLYVSAAQPITVTAIPFGTYIQNNPSAYAAGTYNGLAATVTPLRGFSQITFNLQISNFG